MNWKRNKVISIKLRDGGYALLQMMELSGQVAVFDCFRNEPNWEGVDLSSGNVLFYCWLLDSVKKRSEIIPVKEVAAARDLVFPNRSIDSGSDFRKYTLRTGASREWEILMIGDGNLQLVTFEIESGYPVEKLSKIDKSEYAQYESVEMSNLRDYPEFNERLWLCYKKGKNIDPLKEIAFERPLDEDYEVYLSIIDGKTKISEFGY